jgi:hypothetical protein
MRSEIRVRFGFREATIADADALKEGGKDQTLEKENWKVVYDKNELRPSHLISTFMKTLGHADLVIVVLSAKYLQSPYCMTELHALHQNARRQKQDSSTHHPASARRRANRHLALSRRLADGVQGYGAAP